MTEQPSLPLCVSMGEPAGVGIEIAALAWSRRKALALPPFYLVACPALVASRCRRFNLDVPIRECTPQEAAAAFAEALPVVPLAERVPDAPGRLSASTAPAVIAALEICLTHLKDNLAAALVTAPIQKSVLQAAGFPHPGHTEYLGEKATLWGSAPATPLMMLAGRDLRVIPATVHIPLKDVPAALTRARLETVISGVEVALRQDFDLVAPRLALCGLNPHAGENGLMGTEERTVFTPVIEAARKRGLQLTGPHPADTLFRAEARSSYDAAIAAYHDQALIPVKTLYFDETVNITLGLPFVRTSPDHGTALDIAGSGRANPQSFSEALKVARSMADNRRKAKR